MTRVCVQQTLLAMAPRLHPCSGVRARQGPALAPLPRRAARPRARRPRLAPRTPELAGRALRLVGRTPELAGRALHLDGRIPAPCASPAAPRAPELAGRTAELVPQRRSRVAVFARRGMATDAKMPRCPSSV